MSIFSVRLLINSFIKRPSTHFRSFTTSTTAYKYQRNFTKREANLYKQLIQRYMATPMDDDNVEKILEPFRKAVKLQVIQTENFSIYFVIDFFRVILLNK